jgi:hypothetical protein
MGGPVQTELCVTGEEAVQEFIAVPGLMRVALAGRRLWNFEELSVVGSVGLTPFGLGRRLMARVGGIMRT